MANLEKAMSQNLFDKFLPAFGDNTPRPHIPVWDNSQRMFICDEYESAAGNRQYAGVRFCNNLAVVERVGLYHNCTYINHLEIYAFDNGHARLIQRCTYDKVFRSEAFIRAESQRMVQDYLNGMFKAEGTTVPVSQVEAHAKELVDGCYKSFLDEDFNERLIQILPALEQE